MPDHRHGEPLEHSFTRLLIHWEKWFEQHPQTPKPAILEDPPEPKSEEEE